jgi:hypothetical protein
MNQERNEETLQSSLAVHIATLLLIYDASSAGDNEGKAFKEIEFHNDTRILIHGCA